MSTWRLDLAYDGSGFRGYAKQDGQRTVQGELEAALITVLGTAAQTSVAGRTDAGVHARGQVVSFEAEVEDPEKLARKLNGLLGPELAVMGVTETDPGFHARFSAEWRLYRYTIDTGPAPDPLRRHDAWFPGHALDVEALHQVAFEIVGEHDFSTFCRSVEDRSNVRRVETAEWRREGGFLDFWIKANAFCHQMVRSIVGFSYDVARGFTPVAAIGDVIAAKDRSAVATVAPPHGLTLWEVGYQPSTLGR